MTLPPDLPAPVDDGLARHLPGMSMAPVSLPTTTGARVTLAAIPGRIVVYCYPRMGVPDPEGWDLIPGARGCTPQSCGFRDRHHDLETSGVRVFSLSTQDTASQREAAERLHLPFPLLSDARLEFVSAMRLPTFDVGPLRLAKRLTLVARDGVVEHVFYPVFPADSNAVDVLDWLASRQASR